MPATDLQVFNTANWTLDHSILVQLQEPGEAYEAPCPFYLITHPEGNIIVDTGVSHEMASNPDSYGQYGAPHMVEMAQAIDLSAGDTPAEQLSDAGVSVDEIEYVVMTHLHTDHAGNMTDFLDAEFLVSRRELRYAWWPEPAQQLFYLQGDLSFLQKPSRTVTTVVGEYDVFGDGSVVVLSTPGHTPGHQSVQVDLGDETVILGGDVAQLRSGYKSGFMPSFNWSLDESQKSVKKVKSLAREHDATVRLTHEREDLMKM